MGFTVISVYMHKRYLNHNYSLLWIVCIFLWTVLPRCPLKGDTNTKQCKSKSRKCDTILSLFLHLWCLYCILKNKNRQHIHSIIITCVCIQVHTHTHIYSCRNDCVWRHPIMVTWVDFLPHCTWQITKSFCKVPYTILLSLPSLWHCRCVLRIWNKLFYDLYFGEIGACSLQKYPSQLYW